MKGKEIEWKDLTVFINGVPIKDVVKITYKKGKAEKSTITHEQAEAELLMKLLRAEPPQ